MGLGRLVALREAGSVVEAAPERAYGHDEGVSAPEPVEGLYDALLTPGLAATVAGWHAETRSVPDAESAALLGEHVGREVARQLARLRPEHRVAAANAALAAVGAAADERALEGPQRLLEVSRTALPGGWQLVRMRPEVPLSRPALLTNAHRDPKLGAELRAELASADGVDLLCAFVKWHGLRVLEQQLHELRSRGRPLRVLTTTYMGATDRRALDRLVRDFHAQVKVNYETQSTRLHAKAWLFRRNTGYHTAYIGSSNLSKAALLDGLEWNVRLASDHTPELVEKFSTTFNSYWADPGFVDYDPETDAERLDDALAQAGGATSRSTATLTISGLQVRPYPHQQEILDRIDVERTVHNRHRNLVVAATGTGKTVIAALDFKRLLSADRDLTLLFVAHRQELLDQALRTYREVLANGAFGETWVGGSRPQRWQHVFASVQSLTAAGLATLAPDRFDVIVVDEFHHAQASTYRRLLDHLQPRELLGLTATPERGDGFDVRALFQGRSAAELRLWDALEADLLCPFHYFGVSDGTDLSQLGWRRGDYDTSELERVYTGDDARVRLVLQQLRDKILDIGKMRALGFCVSVRHAEFMAGRFSAAGISARAVTGETSADERRSALQGLRDGHVQVLFTVDLFNEGLDLPDVDTLLLLRPTQSATVFLQQLGRGLRRTPGKAVLTVLDLIGQQRREFRFDRPLRALTGSRGRRLERQVEQGFPFLPSGCEIVLDPVAQRTVLESVRRCLDVRQSELVAELRAQPTDDLATWLELSGRALGDVLRRGSWTTLRRKAGLATLAAGPREDQLLKRVAGLAHVDDGERAVAYDRLLTGPTDYAALPQRQQRYARMLFFTLWPGGGGHASYQDGFDVLHSHEALRDELRQVVALGLAHADHVSRPLESGMEEVPLATHARYSREELLAAVDYASLRRLPASMREGVAFAEPSQTDVLLFSIDKTESDYSPTTMYRDHALTPDLFHWESQSTTAATSPTGVRYREHRARGSHVLLFARRTQKNEWGGTAPYLCLGPATYVSHAGSRPMAITWRLREPLPILDYLEMSINA